MRSFVLKLRQSSSKLSDGSVFLNPSQNHFACKFARLGIPHHGVLKQVEGWVHHFDVIKQQVINTFRSPHNRQRQYNTRGRGPGLFAARRKESPGEQKQCFFLMIIFPRSRGLPGTPIIPTQRTIFYRGSASKCRVQSQPKRC